jgi:hypothetical protein
MACAKTGCGITSAHPAIHGTNEATEHYRVTQAFLSHRKTMLGVLLNDEEQA